jgi:hypothetical protein
MVEYLTINEVKYPVIINYYVIGDFQKETGYSFNDLGNLMDKLYLVEPLIYYAIKYGCLVTKTEMAISREDMPILLAENKVYQDFFQLVPNFFPKDTSGSKKK